MEPSFLSDILRKNKIETSPECVGKLCALADLLRGFNSRTNITAITDDAGIALRHYADCMLALPYIPRGATLIDVGAGGGFPSLPIAIARPDVSVTALDSTAKKLDFVREAAETLGIGNISTLAMRAEDAGRDPLYRERFDVVTARAVAKLNVLCELCLPLISRSGKFFAYKGTDGLTECDSASSACSILGASAPECIPFTLHGGDTEHSRILIFIQKILPTPSKYPRQYSQIAKKAL